MRAARLAVLACAALLLAGCGDDSDASSSSTTTTTTVSTPDLDDMELSEQIDTLAEAACVVLDRDLAGVDRITSEMEERYQAMSSAVEAQAREAFGASIENHCPYHADELAHLAQR